MKRKKDRPKVVAVDFDGTMCHIFPKGQRYIPKKKVKEAPNAHIVEVCRGLQKEGVKIIIYSSRWWGDYAWMKEWLDKNQIPYDGIVLGKFKADAFLDDTTVNPWFEKDWDKHLRKILEI